MYHWCLYDRLPFEWDWNDLVRLSFQHSRRVVSNFVEPSHIPAHVSSHALTHNFTANRTRWISNYNETKRKVKKKVSEMKMNHHQRWNDWIAIVLHGQKEHTPANIRIPIRWAIRLIYYCIYTYIVYIVYRIRLLYGSTTVNSIVTMLAKSKPFSLNRYRRCASAQIGSRSKYSGMSSNWKKIYKAWRETQGSERERERARMQYDRDNNIID